MKQKLSLCLVSCLTLLSSSAFAAGDRAAAQKYFEQGAEYYFNGEYGKAIVEFMRGNDEIPNALFLYNISLSHSRLGNFNDALEFGRRAREMGGLDPATSAQNEGRISALSGLFVLAIALGIIRERTGRLDACILAHALFNTFNLLLALATTAE